MLMLMFIVLIIVLIMLRIYAVRMLSGCGMYSVKQAANESDYADAGEDNKHDDHVIIMIMLM